MKIILALNEYVYVQNESNGLVYTYAGPMAFNLKKQERFVKYNKNTKTFDPVNTIDDAKEHTTIIERGSWGKLQAPASLNKYVRMGQCNSQEVLYFGEHTFIEGPFNFALFPGQEVTIIKQNEQIKDIVTVEFNDFIKADLFISYLIYIDDIEKYTSKEDYIEKVREQLRDQIKDISVNNILDDNLSSIVTLDDVDNIQFNNFKIDKIIFEDSFQKKYEKYKKGIVSNNLEIKIAEAQNELLDKMSECDRYLMNIEFEKTEYKNKIENDLKISRLNNKNDLMDRQLEILKTENELNKIKSMGEKDELCS